MARINLRYSPSPHETKTVDFPRLTGGLNLRDEPVQLGVTESPDLLNVWWDSGTLHSRPGMVCASYPMPNSVRAYAASDVFHDYTIIHAGTSFYAYKYAKGERPGWTPDRVYNVGVPESAGTFTVFGDYLYYKNDGGFFRISPNPDFDVDDDTSKRFAVDDLSVDAFVPTIMINADPSTGSGDIYQPENRLSPRKRVTYTPSNEKTSTLYFAFEYLGAATHSRILGITGDDIKSISEVRVNGTQLKGVETVTGDGEYHYDFDSGWITFRANEALSGVQPGSTFYLQMDVMYSLGVVFNLPVRDIDSVNSVIVDGVKMVEDVDYDVNTSAGSVHLKRELQQTVPPRQNNVEIVYSKSNTTAYDAVMSCKYVTTYGSGTQMCLVFGGSSAQPGVVFWSGNNNTGIDASYVPMDSYNLIGDSQDTITGFGHQYDQLIAFQENSISKLVLDFQTVNDRIVIALNSQRVNDRIGCDLPSTIQLVENNLVFANTDGGVYMLLPASAAYENNVLCISKKINGTENRSGLLDSLRDSSAEYVHSYDDGRCYYLHAFSASNETMWIWEHDLSPAENPSWFRWRGFSAAVWIFGQQHKTFILNANGTVSVLDNTELSDRYLTVSGGTRILDSAVIEKHYQFPPQNFGSYYREKEVTTLTLAVPSSFTVRMKLYYQDDYGVREDLIDLTNVGFGEDIERPLNISPYAVVFRKRPRNKHIKHFAFRLENNSIGEDLAIFSAQLQYKLLGKLR